MFHCPDPQYHYKQYSIGMDMAVISGYRMTGEAFTLVVANRNLCPPGHGSILLT